MSQEQVQQFIAQATQSIQSGQYAQALELIEQAIALAPTESEAFVLRGIALAGSQRPDEATESFRKAILLSPYNSKAYFNLAVHQYQLGNKVEALEMAREAAKVDPRNSGARELMTRIEAEMAGPATTVVSTPNPADPLSGPATAGPAPSEPVQAAAPVQTSGPIYTPPPSTPPGGYVRPGYEQATGGSLQFVENLGGKWTLIGWLLAAASLIGLILAVALLLPVFSQAMASAASSSQANQAESQAQMTAAMQGSPLYWPMNLLYYGSLLGGILWTILDLVNRRGNFVWIIPMVACSCCGFGWLILPIYLLAGRRA